MTWVFHFIHICENPPLKFSICNIDIFYGWSPCWDHCEYISCVIVLISCIKMQRWIFQGTIVPITNVGLISMHLGDFPTWQNNSFVWQFPIIFFIKIRKIMFRHKSQPLRHMAYPGILTVCSGCPKIRPDVGGWASKISALLKISDKFLNYHLE